MPTSIIYILNHSRADAEIGGDYHHNQNNDGDTDDDNDEDDVIPMATGRGHKKRASSTATAVTDTMGTHPEETRNPLKNTRQPTLTSELPSTIRAPVSVPRADMTSEQQSSEIQELGRTSVQVKPRDKLGTLKLNGPKRKRFESGMTAEAINRGKRTLKTTEPSSTRSYQSPTNRSPESTPSPKASNEATQTVGEFKVSSIQPRPYPKQTRLTSDTTTEAADEVRYTISTAESFSNQPHPLPILPMSADFIGQSASIAKIPVPSPSTMIIDAKKQSKTTLWIFIPSSTDAVPLRLRSCMTMTSLFDSVFKIWGLAEQQQQDRVLGLRTTLGWTQNDGAKRYLMVKRGFEDSFEIFLETIDGSPCWEQEDACCSVAIEAVLA